MNKIDFTIIKHIHFIGIGGISMSGLAEILNGSNYVISGSDISNSDTIQHLKSLGIKIFIGQHKENITPDIDLVVYTAAIHPDNEEFLACKEAGILMITRADLLGYIMDNYNNSIAVSGTHGKTTTTSMISQILLAASLDPTISVGGILDSIGGNIRVGNSDVFITEACEYTNSFLSLYPKYNIILNIEEDHLDFFKDINDIRNSFSQFASNTKNYGTIIINGAILNIDEITKTDAKIITYGLNENNDLYAENITYNSDGIATFNVVFKGNSLGGITLGVPGKHNVENSLAACAVCLDMNIDFDIIKNALLAFGGTKRRFEFKGKLNDITIIDDYAHHPTEIKATLNTAKTIKANRIICVFQPHTYTRTKALFDDFIDALSLADVVVFAEIYAAREVDNLGMSSSLLCDKLKALGKESYYFSTFDEIENFLLKNCINNDLVITMGAGNVNLVGEHLLGQ